MMSYVLITGAAGGLGKAFAAECASRGWDLFLTDVSEQSLAPLATGMQRLFGVETLYHVCDLTDPDARKGLWEHIAQHGPRFSMLINVAGLDFEGPFQERSVDELCAIVRLNVEATLAMTRQVLEHRAPERPLRIVNVSSLASFYPMPVKAVYAASKRFLTNLSLALNQELCSSGVTVTALCPAGLPTTPACVESIRAQGWMGQITTMQVGDVAARTLDLALAGRSLYVPGGVNQVLRALGSLVPTSIVVSLIEQRWRQTRKLRGDLAGPVRLGPVPHQP